MAVFNGPVVGVVDDAAFGVSFDLIAFDQPAQGVVLADLVVECSRRDVLQGDVGVKDQFALFRVQRHFLYPVVVGAIFPAAVGMDFLEREGGMVSYSR